MKQAQPIRDRRVLRPTVASSLALLTLGPAAAWAQSTLPLDAVYHYGRISAEHTQACSVPEVVTTAEFGVLALLPNGSLSLSGNDHSNCSGGLWSQSVFNDVGTYTFSIDGDLLLDLDPSAPGTDTARMDVSWDGMVAVGEDLEVGEPALTLAVRGSTGLGNDALSGEYAIVGLAQDNLIGGGIEGAVDPGVIIFDGAGGYTVKTSWFHLDPTGKSEGSDPTQFGSYSVRSTDGRISFDGDPDYLAAISPDGRIGFAVEMTAGESTGLSIFVRKPSNPPVTTGAFDLDWTVAQYGAELSTGGGPTEVQLASSHGKIAAVASQATFSTDLDSPFADSGGGGIVLDDTGGGVFTLPQNGLLQLYPSSIPPAPVYGWLCDSEDLVVFWDTTDTDFIAGGILLRDWGPLAVDKDELSAAAGGTQTMSLRAGISQAGLPYLILGSLSGAWPGFPADGKTVPLNFDAYTSHTLGSPNTPPLAASFGILDASGSATATFSLPPGAPPIVAGMTFTHAYATIELLPTHLWLPLISNPVECRIVP